MCSVFELTFSTCFKIGFYYKAGIRELRSLSGHWGDTWEKVKAVFLAWLLGLMQRTFGKGVGSPI